MTYKMLSGDNAEAEFADYQFENGTLVHNSQFEADGAFRRMITTPKGLDITMWNGVPAAEVGALAVTLDRVATVNFEAGLRDKMAEIRKVLGVKA